MENVDTARLGILMLDTRFPRIKGDVGNPDSWTFPVTYSVVSGATPEAIVHHDPEPFVQAFIQAGHALVAEGCTGIATTCGFLSPLRDRLADALGVPVAASSLEQFGLIALSLPRNACVSILTISEQSLTTAHLSAAGVPEGTPVQGMEGTEFARSILGNLPELDVDLAGGEMVSAAMDLVTAYPQTGAILFECTNMGPYADMVAQATGRPVYSILTYLNWFHAGLKPAPFLIC